MSWVVVTSDDAFSQRQIEVCRRLRPEHVQGAVKCDHIDNAHADICREAEYFPAFCDARRNECVYGLRDTREALDALKTIAPTPPSV